MITSDAGSQSTRAGVVRPAIVTVGLALLVLVAERIPLPSFGAGDVGRLVRDDRLRELSFLGVGLMPYFLAFAIVECVAAAVPRLRPLRHGSAEDRAPLTRAAWWLAAALAAVQAAGTALDFQRLRDMHGEFLLAPGALPVLAVASTMVVGTMAAGAAALAISRHGVGQGFAVLFGVLALEDLLDLARFHARVALAGGWPDSQILLVLSAAVVLALVVAHRLRHPPPRPRVAVPTCGLVPLQVAPTLLVVPGTVAWWLGRSRLAVALWPGATALAAATVALAIGLAVALSRAFCPADPLVRAFARAATERPSEEDAAALRRALGAANRRSWALVAVLAAAPLANVALDVQAPLHVWALLDLGLVVAVAADLATELAARAGQPLAPARALHRVYAVPAALEALEAAGIPAFARGWRYRSLFHFFAPYAPVEIWTPPERTPEADAICARVAADPSPL